MTKITWKAGTLLAPVPPALISCGTMDSPNVMTAAWTGIICTEPTLVYVSVRPSRYSNELIRKTKEFVINVPNLELARAVDWCGVKSGRALNKFAEAGITAKECSAISAPQVAEAPISLECKVKEITNFGTHDMFLAEVVAVDIDDKYINDKGALDLSKAHLLAYAHGFYYTLSEQLGKFGWSVEKNEKAQQKTDNKIKKHLTETKKVEISDNTAKKKEDFTHKTGRGHTKPFANKKFGERKTEHSKFSEKKFDNKKSAFQKKDSAQNAKIIHHKPIKKRVVVFK